MPSLPTVPRRRQRSEEEEDADETSSPAPSSQSSNTSKRARLQPRAKSGGGSDDEDMDVDSAPEEESGSQEVDGGGDEEDDEDGSEPPTPTQAQTQTQASADGNDGVEDRQDAVDAGGYKPGSIVRIRVNDFVTYTSAEFFPGPKLNMVIGPNGTGKSTLVCAICLGLGWGPQVRRTAPLRLPITDRSSVM